MQVHIQLFDGGQFQRLQPVCIEELPAINAEFVCAGKLLRIAAIDPGDEFMEPTLWTYVIERAA